MPRTINVGQFYGGLIGAGFWALLAIWYLYIRPHSIRRRIDRGDIDAFDRLAKLRQGTLIGYSLLLIAIFDLIGTLNYIGVFGDWICLPLLAAVLIAMFFVIRQLWRQHTGP